MRLPVMALVVAIAAISAVAPAHAHEGNHVLTEARPPHTTDYLFGVPYGEQGPIPTNNLLPREFASISDATRMALAEREAQISRLRFSPGFGDHATLSAPLDASEWTLIEGDAGAVDSECRRVGDSGRTLAMLEVISVRRGTLALVAHEAPEDTSSRIHVIYEPDSDPSIPGTVPGVRSCAYLLDGSLQVGMTARTASSSPDGRMPDRIVVEFSEDVGVTHWREHARSGWTGYYPRLGDFHDGPGDTSVRTTYCASCTGAALDALSAQVSSNSPPPVLNPHFDDELVLSPRSLNRAQGMGPESATRTDAFWNRYLVEWSAVDSPTLLLERYPPGIFRAIDMDLDRLRDNDYRDYAPKRAAQIASGPTGLIPLRSPIPVLDGLPPAPAGAHSVSGSVITQSFTEAPDPASLEGLTVWRAPAGTASASEVAISRASLSGSTLTFTASGILATDHLEYVGIADSATDGAVAAPNAAARPVIAGLERISDTQTAVMLDRRVAGTTAAAHWTVGPAGGTATAATGAAGGHLGSIVTPEIRDHVDDTTRWVTLTHAAITGDGPRAVSYSPPAHTSYDDRFAGRLAASGVRLDAQTFAEALPAAPAITGARFDGPTTILVGLDTPAVSAPETMRVRLAGATAVDAPVSERPTAASPATRLTLTVAAATSGGAYRVTIAAGTITAADGLSVPAGGVDAIYTAGPYVSGARTVSPTRTDVTISGLEDFFGGTTAAAHWTVVEDGAERAVTGVGYVVGSSSAAPSTADVTVLPARPGSGEATIRLAHAALSSSLATPEVRYAVNPPTLGSSHDTAQLGSPLGGGADPLPSTSPPHPVAADGAPVAVLSARTVPAASGD
ncbi:MAG: hypothetical protein OXD41_00040, partial [Thaumarchaeota archaeon]|nr:hypothetical protein [Nitrososphaerota archaeon]